jgi:RNA polymerase sigma-70 factor (ECF subfamily)
MEALYTAYHGDIVSFMVRRCHDDQLAEDLAATVFLRALNARDGSGYRGEGAARSWLYAIANNLWRDHLRLKYRRPFLPLDDAADLAVYHDPGYFPADPPLLERAQRQLKATQAEVIALELQGYSFAEIAAHQGRTVGAVKTMRHRAVANLRYLLTNGQATEQ